MWVVFGKKNCSCEFCWLLIVVDNRDFGKWPLNLIGTGAQLFVLFVKLRNRHKFGFGGFVIIRDYS